MRLGISTSLNCSSANEWAETLAKNGLKSVVFPLDCNAPSDKIDEYVKAAADNDLVIAEVGIWRNAIAMDSAEREANLEYSIKQLQLADYIGAKCCVNVAGAMGTRWDGGYKENYSDEAWKRTVHMIQEVIDSAKPKNAFFTIESMPWMIPSSPEDYLRLIDDVNRDEFSVHLDIINMINCPERYFMHEEFLEHTFELLGPQIKSCHMKDIRLLDDYTFQLRECPCGEGVFNLEKYVELADKVNPEMPMIIEHLTSDEQYFESVRYVKNRLGGV
ncbi:MAG: sugar phosphate isomerase/epimerase [Clostridia bacterium]|nr:sugar phosphate isomerase/epimerase [Clostridia bacterium]